MIVYLTFVNTDAFKDIFSHGKRTTFRRSTPKRCLHTTSVRR